MAQITVAAITILGFVVFAEPDIEPDNHWRYIAHFALRLSLALFVEVFAYFFLRLYRQSLDEIKYYQNELTNLEMKFVGVRLSTTGVEAKLLKVAVNALMNTERNFILKKGETTVNLERDRQDKNEVLEIFRETLNYQTGKRKK